jgi:hypothetical protein
MLQIFRENIWHIIANYCVPKYLKHSDFVLKEVDHPLKIWLNFNFQFVLCPEYNRIVNSLSFRTSIMILFYKSTNK